MNFGQTIALYNTPLFVPKSDEATAIEHGATWNDTLGVWQIRMLSPFNTDRFEKWIPSHISEYFYIATGEIFCWKCEEEISVHSIMLPPKSLQWVHSEWNTSHYPTRITGFSCIPKPTRIALEKEIPSFRMGYSKTSKKNAFMNYCTFCNVLQGDWFMHSSPGGIFFPMDHKQAERVLVRKIETCFVTNHCSGFPELNFWESFDHEWLD